MITVRLNIDAPTDAFTMLNELVAALQSIDATVTDADASSPEWVARVRDGGTPEYWCNLCEEWHA